MLRTWASTVLRVTKSWSAMPRSVLPCGDEREDVALARRELGQRVAGGWGGEELGDERGLDDGAAGGDLSSAATNSATSAIRSLSR